MAGMACVEQILKYAPQFEITVFGDETHVNYNRIMLSSVLAGEKAADDIVHMTDVVTARVSTSTRAMETSAGRVGEIERVSRDIDAALSAIGDAAERTRIAAVGVSGAAEANAQAVTSAATSLESIAKTAEGHAVAAEQVNASTQEQSAACEQMTSASNVLLAGSTQLRELVGGLRT